LLLRGDKVRRILELLFGSDDRRGSYRPLFEAIGIKEEEAFTRLLSIAPL
jgi:hypothetical protein